MLKQLNALFFYSNKIFDYQLFIYYEVFRECTINFLPITRRKYVAESLLSSGQKINYPSP